MNFLDAHKIFDEYTAVVVKGNYSKQALPCNGNLEQINNATIIVMSHCYFYQLDTQEYYDSLFSVALALDRFKDENILKQEEKLERCIMKNSKFPWSKIKKWIT